jgi:Lysozyme like domain
MTQLSPRQIVQLLAQHLGAKNTYNTVYAVEICLAESGGNTLAISGAGARGLWQILPSAHFGDGIIGWGNWTDPVVNAREMWKISGGLQNWAAWTSAWANEAAANYSGYLHTPQSGSAAEGHEITARQAVTQYFLNPPTGPSGPALTPLQQDEAAINNRINAIRAYFRTVFPQQIANTDRYSRFADRSW